MVQKYLNIILLFITLTYITNSIQFSYTLQQRQMQCFHQSAQKGFRFQIDIKSNSPLYGFQVNEHSTIHTDTRPQQYKYFSAFANTDVGVTFCINSLTDTPIQLQIQFYHGFYLQTTQNLKNADEFLSMTRRMQEISNLIKMNYNKYKSQILERQPINNRIQIISTFGIIAFLLIVGFIKVWYLNKVIKFMKIRKLI